MKWRCVPARHMVEDSQMLDCDKGPDAETAEEPTVAHAQGEFASEADHFTEAASASVEAPVDETEHPDPATVMPAGPLNRPRYSSHSVSARMSDRKTAAISLLLTIAIYAMAGTIGFLILHRFGNGKHWAWQIDAAAPGDVSLRECPTPVSEQKPAMPTLSTQAPDPFPPPDVSATEETVRDSAPQAFASAPTREPDEPTVEPILIAVGPMPAWREAPSVRQQQKAATQPSSEAASAPAAPRPITVHSSTAVAASDKPVANPNPTAASVAPARQHVWTHASPNGGGGRGGLTEGFDTRGVPLPIYPPESRRRDRSEEGVVQLEVEVRADGTVGNVRVLSDAGFPRLAAAAVEAIHRGHFIPATCDGQPVAEKLVIPYLFQLQH